MRCAEGAWEGGEVGEGMCLSQEFFIINVNFTHFAAFCEDYKSLRLVKST